MSSIEPEVHNIAMPPEENNQAMAIGNRHRKCSEVKFGFVALDACINYICLI